MALAGMLQQATQNAQQGGGEWLGGAPQKGGGKGGAPEWVENPLYMSKVERWKLIDRELEVCLQPHLHLEAEWTPEQWKQKISSHINKQVTKFEKEYTPALSNYGHAGSLVAEFVASVLGAIENSAVDRAWAGMVDFTGPIFQAVLLVFKSQKMFRRVTGSRVQTWVSDAYNRWHEEKRVEKAMWETVQMLGLEGKQVKTAWKALENSYDEAIDQTTFVIHEEDVNGLIMLQSFIQYWFKTFVTQIWDSLRAQGSERIYAMSVSLFQTLCSPEIKALPYDVAGQMDSETIILGWSGSIQKLEVLFAQVEQAKNPRGYGAPAAKKQKGGGYNPWEGMF